MKEDNITSGCASTLYCPDNPVPRGDMAIFIVHGAFNQLLPATEPILSAMSPATIAPGTSGTFLVNGVNTHFVQGMTTIAPIPGVTIGLVTAFSPIGLSVELTAASGAIPQPVSVVAITGNPPANEEAVLPNGLVIQ